VCHAVVAIAKERCRGYSSSLGATQCNIDRTGKFCAMCAKGYFADDTKGGDCAVCPVGEVVLNRIYIFAGIFAGIALSAFALVAIVQTVFGRDVMSGAMRSLRFAGWIVSSLAMQAQIGRTASKGQHDLMSEYFKFLQVFEINPDSATPTECAGSSSLVSLTAMGLSTGLALAFVLLATPCVTAPMIWIGEKIRQKEGDGDESNDESNDVLASQSSSVFFGDSSTDVSGGVIGRSGDGGNGIRGSNPMRVKKVELVTTSISRHAVAVEGMASNPMQAQRATAAASAAAPAVVVESETHVSLLIAEYRSHFPVVLVPGTEAATLKKKCCCNKKTEKKEEKKKTQKDQKKMSTGHCLAKVLGMFRKCLAGSIFLRHPLVTNIAFNAVFCIEDVDSEEFSLVVAAAPNVLCFGEEHLATFIMAVVTILVSIIGFPLYALVTLSRSAGWCGKLSVKRAAATRADGDESSGEYSMLGSDTGAAGAPPFVEADGAAPAAPAPAPAGNALALEDGEGGVELVSLTPRFTPLSSTDGTTADTDTDTDIISTDIEVDPFKGPGPISRGLCCRGEKCVEMMVATRGAFDELHSMTEFPARAQAWTSFTHSDYKPEFFYFRILFFTSITLLAMANTFLNPDFMRDPTLWTPTSLLIAQIARFVVCAVAVMIPSVLLLGTLPMKTSSRWKLSLRVACAVVSTAMLLFNILSKADSDMRDAMIVTCEADHRESEADLVACMREVADTEGRLDWLAYTVLALSVGLLVMMAVMFVIFVVFRGAQLQKRSEDANELKEAEQELVEALRVHLHHRKQMRQVTAWRVVAVKQIAEREEEQQRLNAAAAAAVLEEAERRRAEAETVSTAASAAEVEAQNAAAAAATADGAAAAAAAEHEHVAAAAAVPALPEGWTAHIDAVGTPYYHNAETGETRWSAPDDSMPDGWRRVDDEASGRAFYHHDETNRTVWERPRFLPRDWVAANDDVTSIGGVIFKNTRTMETMRDEPCELDGGWSEDRSSASPHYTNSITNEESTSRPAPLLPGWTVSVDAAHGNHPYYANISTGEVSWEKPKMLPHGWTQLADEASGKVYYYNTVTGAMSWERPVDLAAAAEDAMVKEKDEEEAPPPPRLVSHKARKKQKRKKRWKWESEVSLGDSLFKSKVSGGGVTIPPYLSRLFAKIYANADRSGSGALSTVEFTLMLQRRAKGTALAGDAHAILTLKTLCAKQAGSTGRGSVITLRAHSSAEGTSFCTAPCRVLRCPSSSYPTLTHCLASSPPLSQIMARLERESSPTA